MNETIVGELVAAAEREPDRHAILEKRLGRWRSVGIGELVSSAGAYRGGMVARGLQPGDTVALFLRDGADSVAIDLAVMAAGAISLPVPREATGADLVAVLSNLPPRIIIVQGQHDADRLLHLIESGSLPRPEHLVYVDPAGVSEYPDPLLAPVDAIRSEGAPLRTEASDPNSAAAGSVGLGASAEVHLHSQRQLLEGSRAAVGAFKLRPTDRVVLTGTLSAPAERAMTIYPTLLAGGRLAVPESWSTVAAALHEVAPSFAHIPGRMLADLAGGLLVRFSETRRGKALVSRWWQGRTDASLTSYGADRAPGTLGRVVVGLPALEKIGLDKARHITVGGAPVSSDLLAFVRSLGLDAQRVLTHPAVSGPIAVDGRPVADLADLTGPAELAFHVEGGVVVGADPMSTLEELLVSSPLVRSAAAMGAGDGVDVVLEIARRPVARWAQLERLDATTYRSYASLPRLHELLENHTAAAVRRLGMELASVHISPRPFDDIAGALDAFGSPRRQALAASRP